MTLALAGVDHGSRARDARVRSVLSEAPSR